MDMQEEIARRVRDAFPDVEITLRDVTGGGDHWQGVFVSASFEGLNRLQRQRAIYGALGDLMHGPIHALTFQAMTPEQYELEN